jgi:molybdate transport system substrate-binding protein
MGLILVWPLAVRAEKVTVFAAASLVGPLDDIAAAWSQDTGHEVVVSYAGSSVLARQIQNGAPADLFISANPAWMDHLIAGGQIGGESRQVILSNTLVLISFRPGDPVDVAKPEAMLQALGRQRLVVALTEAVPAGVYARQALSHLGLWDAVQGQLVQTDHVRAALGLVGSGAAPWGIVYASDAVADPRVHGRARSDPTAHDPILYPAGITVGAGAAAQAFLDHLSGDAAQQVFIRTGFLPVGEGKAQSGQNALDTVDTPDG